MIPIVTPQEMAEIDRQAPDPVEVLIGRAGAATARVALEVLGGGYGRRVAVLAGPGNNGQDGRDAARRLARRGVRVVLHELGELPGSVDDVDLVIDALLGTGARPGFAGPRIAERVPVLAVDLPSGLDGLTGEAGPGVLRADRTVTFAALKPGLVLAEGPRLSGETTVVDIGLDTSSARAGLVTDADARTWMGERSASAHKWRSAVWVVAGSPGMTGAAHLATRAAMRAGAGYVRLSTPGVHNDAGQPVEAVGHSLPGAGWADHVVNDAERFRALVVGPGLGRGAGTATEVRALLRRVDTPVVLDGDGLAAVGRDHAVLKERSGPTVLTPHDGEHRLLAGEPPVADRFEAVRRLAWSTGSVVLLKGPTTLVSDPTGRVMVVRSGDARLATAGTGDVLSGVIAGLLASGTTPLEAAAAGAHLHGRAGAVGSGRGLVASDLIDHLPLVFDQI